MAFLAELNENLFWGLNQPLGTTADYIMIAITCTGYTIPAAIIGIAAMKFYGGLNKKNIWMLTLTLIIGGIAVQGIKQVYIKDRPLGYFGEQSAKLKAKVHAPFKQPHHRTFPSGHSQTGFSVAMMLILIFNKHRPAWLIWASLIALSRVYLGVHFPVDIVFGSLFGAVSAYAAFKILGEKAKEA